MLLAILMKMLPEVLLSKLSVTKFLSLETSIFKKNNGILLKGGFPAVFSIQLLRKFWSGGKLASPEMLLYCHIVIILTDRMDWHSYLAATVSCIKSSEFVKQQRK